MQHWRTAEWGVVGVVLLSLVVAGTVPGSGWPAHATLDDGDATVSDVSVPTDDLRIDRGRFGTGVYYLRVPDATLRVDDYDGTPRLVYRVAVPALGVDGTSTDLVTRTGRVTLAGEDQGMGLDEVRKTGYDATVEVRVQSFAVDETVYSQNVSVEVQE